MYHYQYEVMAVIGIDGSLMCLSTTVLLSFIEACGCKFVCYTLRFTLDLQAYPTLDNRAL